MDTKAEVNNLLCEEKTNPVYETAMRIFDLGFHITVLYDYQKMPKDMMSWTTKRYPPEPGMTGVGIVTGTPCYINGKQHFVYALDIDIYRKDRREKILSKILEHIGKPVYLELTPSKGYRIVFYCENFISNKSKKFDFSEINDAAKHKDNVDYCAKGKQVLIAPSKAENKSGKIKEYIQISDVGLLESALLTEFELENLLEMLKCLSHRYSSQTFQHRHTVSPERREEIKQLHQHLKSKGYITGPLYNGERHCTIPDWKKGVDAAAFDEDNLTGIVLKLGKQKDGTYLNVFDIDHIKGKKDKLGELPFEVMEQFKALFGEIFYSEASVSEGYHILFSSKESLDVNKKWKLPNGKVLEVLSTKHEAVNLAPTSTYINKYEYSGFPEYGDSFPLSNIDNIPMVDAESVRNFVNTLESCRKSNSFKLADGSNYNLNSLENQAVIKYMRQYGSLSEINRQIKLKFPKPIDLFNFLGMEHSNRYKPQYMNFYSLYADDGNNPDAILFYNNNKDPKNTWTGYSVQDFHSGEVMSFGQYLCKHRRDLFEKLMEKIGFGKPDKAIPIATVNSSVSVVEYKCGQYISDDIRMKVLADINQTIQNNQGTGKQTKILITAPTGVGKTEMFYQLAKDQHLKMILALPYTSQVLQGKLEHDEPGVIEGLCDKDHDVPKTGSIFMTYDKASIVEENVNPSEYVMIIDEAHNLVNHVDFRKGAIHNLQKFSGNCKAVIYMTATPEYINQKDLDLVIKIDQENLPLKKAHVFKYKSQAVNKVADAVVSQHIPGTIDVIYIRSKSQISMLQKLLQQKSIESHIIQGDLKDNSQVYDNLSKHQRLSENNILKEGGVLLTTNLIVDGVNIKDENIGNCFLINIQSTTDLIQFPSRFRNGFKNYFLFVSGKKPEYIEQRNRQELTEKYYNLAYHQKQSFDIFRYNLDKFVVLYGIESDKISLPNRFTYLDSNGNISENTILQQVQVLEARRMNYNISEIEAFLKPYNFIVTEISNEDMAQDIFSEEEREECKIDFTGETEEKLTELIKILKNKDDIYHYERQELLKDYLKKKQSQFESLVQRLNIRGHRSTGKYVVLWESKDCMNVLKRYCSGLELYAENIFQLLRDKYNDTILSSIKRVYHNLELEQNAITPTPDDRYWRFFELRKCVREVKRPGVPLTITKDQLLAFARDFNSRYAAVYSEYDVKQVVEDLNDIFDVQPKRFRDKNRKKIILYTILEEWTFMNIHGITFRR